MWVLNLISCKQIKAPPYSATDQLLHCLQLILKCFNSNKGYCPKGNSSSVSYHKPVLLGQRNKPQDKYLKIC